MAAVVLLLGAALAAVYFLVIKPGDEEPAVARTPSPSPTTTKPAATKPAPTAPAPTPAAAPTPAPAPPAAAAPPAAIKAAPPPPEVAKKIDVSIETKPATAKVAIDGATAAPAPLKLSLDAGKSHELVASAACYQDEKLSIDPAKQDKVTIKMKPLERLVRVTTEPSGAIVLVDGKSAGKSPVDVRLVGRLDPKSPHTFTFRRQGFVETDTVVPADAPCATDGDVGVVGLAYTLTPQKRPVAATPPPAPAPVRRPAPKPTPAAATPPAPTEEPKPAAEPKPPAEEPKPEPPKPAAEEPKVIPPPKEEPKAAPPPEPAAPEPAKPAEPKPAPAPSDKKDCDPSPDAPDWARCK
jgi:PEGA domain-containing protein